MIKVDSHLYSYIIEHSLHEHQVLQNLRAYTENEIKSTKQVSPDQGQFLAFLVKLINAKNILELGTFTGYSCLSMALALPDDGYITTCDISNKYLSLAQHYWQQANVRHKITHQISPAVDFFQLLLAQKNPKLFDLIFLDADKTNQEKYFEYSLQLLPKGGMMIIDNTLWKGRIIDASFQDKNTIAIRNLNNKLSMDNRIDLSIIPIGDGMTLIRKR